MLRFKNKDGLYYPDWEESTVSECCSFINGKAHENNIVESGKYVVVNSKFVSSNGIVRKYSDKQIEPLFKDDIVFVMSDVPNGKAIAKCYLIERDNLYTLNQRICALRTKQNSYFMMAQINRNKYYLKFDDGVKQTNLRKEDVLNCPLLIPCIEEQERIVDCLSSVDEVISTIESEVALWEEKKRGVMKKIFSQEVRFKKENGTYYPEWEEKKIGDILTIYHGRDYKHLGKGDIPVLGTGGVITYVDDFLCDWSCVLIGRKGTIDKPQYMESPFWSVDTLFYSKPHNNQLPKFQYYLFQTIDWKKHNEASGVPSLSASIIEKLKVRIPSYEE